MRCSVRALVLVALAVGCADGAREGRRNVLWLTIDTLRADRLGCYGCERETSPRIDALAAGGVRFERAYSTAPWTIPSVATMMTGLMPSAHGMVRPALTFPAEADDVPGAFARAGYRTAAVVSNRNVATGSGFETLFERFDDGEARGAAYVSTPGVVDRCLALLDELAAGEEPFFLFALLCDPHHLYHRHDGVDFAPARGSHLDGTEGIREVHRLLPELDSGDAELLRGLYDEEVWFTDRGVGRLLEGLGERGLAASTLVVLTSDHGEELLERGWLGHTITLHEELVRVPLVLRGPGLGEGLVRTDPVSLLELGPAVLELAGVHAPEFGPTRLAALARGDADRPEGPPIAFEVDFYQSNLPEKTVRKEGLLQGSRKLIRDASTGTLELYDLDRDPGERSDLAAENGAEAAALEAELDRALDSLRNRKLEPAERELGERQRRILEGLGYGGGEGSD